jgi:hypothetical protein
MNSPPLWTLALLLAGSLTSTAPPVAAQTVYLPENATPWIYVVPPFDAHCLHTYRLFLPQAPHVMPAGGWPVVVHLAYNGYRRSEDTPYLIGGSFLAKYLEAGIAVISARATPSIEVTDPLWFTWCGAPPSIPGHGLFHPPGYIPPDLVAQGIAPYEALEYHMPEKDAVMLLQHVRYKGRQPGPYYTELDQKMALLDHRRIAVHGTSAGAMVLMWAALGPDRRNEEPFAGLGGQHAEPSRPNLAILEKGVTWWPVFDGALAPPTPHFGQNGHSETAAVALAHIDTNEMLDASPMWYEDRTANLKMPIYLSYGEESIIEEYDKTQNACSPYPFCFDGQGSEGALSGQIDYTNFHPAWSGFAWSKQHPAAPVHLVITGEDAYSQRGAVPAIPLYGDPTTQTPAEILAMQYDDMVAWTAAEMELLLQNLPAESWTNVGGALAGSRGLPLLSGSGLLMDGDYVTLSLSSAQPAAPVAAIGGFSVAGAPLLGGILVPTPDLLILNAATVDGFGQASFSSHWPPGLPSGVKVYFQFWIRDPVAPFGYSATNGLMAEVP